MKNAFVFLAAFALGAAVTGELRAAPAKAPAAAKAPARDNNAPINISSDSFQADLNGKTGTWQGNVVVVQGDMKLRANSVRMNTLNGKVDKVLANGNVVVDSPSSGTATGDNGVYSVPTKTVVMNGNVVLKKGKDVMRGSQLTVNMVSGQATLGGGVKGTATPGGRVQAVFQPNGDNP